MAKTKRRSASRSKSRPGKSKSKSTKPHSTAKHRGTKVGSSRKSTPKFARKHDFGIPAKKARPLEGGRDRGRPGASGPMLTEDGGRRDVGVGWPRGPAGTGSGGDASPDFTGAGTGGSTVTDSGELERDSAEEFDEQELVDQRSQIRDE